MSGMATAPNTPQNNRSPHTQSHHSSPPPNPFLLPSHHHVDYQNATYMIFNDVPSVKISGPLSLMAPSTSAYLCPGDCVEIQSSENFQFIGHIIDASFGSIRWFNHAHPFIHSSHCHSGSLVLVNLYLDQNNQLMCTSTHVQWSQFKHSYLGLDRPSKKGRTHPTPKQQHKSQIWSNEWEK